VPTGPDQTDDKGSFDFALRLPTLFAPLRENVFLGSLIFHAKAQRLNSSRKENSIEELLEKKKAGVETSAFIY
jgi:hypothetical protein